MKVRRIECTKDLDNNFRKGIIFYEYGTNPGFFYSEENIDPNGAGFCFEYLKKNKIDSFFKELEPIEFSKTIWYEIAKKDLLSEIEITELGIKVSSGKLKELKSLLKRFE